MKKLYSQIVFAISVLFFAQLSAAEGFPSYLNEKYCTDIKLDFMTTSIRSLQQYREKQLVTRHPGGMNNIRNYLVQRQDWLAECENYLAATSSQHLFKDKSTSDSIFRAIDSVSGELDALIRGVSYSKNAGQTSTAVAEQKFDRLFKLIDDHQTMMLMKGQVVYR